MADTVAYQEVIDRENNPIKYAMKKAGAEHQEAFPSAGCTISHCTGLDCRQENAAILVSEAHY